MPTPLILNRQRCFAASLQLTVFTGFACIVITPLSHYACRRGHATLFTTIIAACRHQCRCRVTLLLHFSRRDVILRRRHYFVDDTTA